MTRDALLNNAIFTNDFSIIITSLRFAFLPIFNSACLTSSSFVSLFIYSFYEFSRKSSAWKMCTHISLKNGPNHLRFSQQLGECEPCEGARDVRWVRMGE